MTSFVNGPGLFSDFGKKAKDLLTRDYLSDQKFSISTLTSSGVALSSNVVEKGGLSSGEVAAEYKNKNTTVDLKVDTESNVTSTVRVTNYPTSTKIIASTKLFDLEGRKVEVQYFHHHAAVTAALNLTKSTAVDFSATVGTPSIAFGAEASYLTSTGDFCKYNAGVNLTKPDFIVSAILADKGDSIRVSYLHHLEELNGGSVVGEISRKFSTNENTLTVGCSYVVDGHTSWKAKLNNHGSLAALIQHEITPKSLLTVSGAFDTKALQKTPKFGVGLSLKP
ncbi:Mitochondrial outer membrane protein porin 2 [Linum grandiflorum]